MGFNSGFKGLMNTQIQRHSLSHYSSEPFTYAKNNL